MKFIGVFAIRTWAIYQRNWFVLGGLLLVSAVKIFISAVNLDSLLPFFLKKIAESNSYE